MKNDNVTHKNFENIVCLTNDKHEVLEILEQTSYPRPFNQLVQSFVFSFSTSLMAHPGIKAFPDLVALAFWMRKANIKKLEEQFFNDSEYRVPVGRVIHFAPSNVDTIFIYSLFLSLLVGNVNVVRVSEKNSEQKNILIDLINKEISKPEFSELNSRLAIITYQHSDELSSFLCSKVDMRVIWGGDSSVNKITSFPISPGATELKFVDKYSLCLLNPEQLDLLSSADYDDLIKRFVNDTYWFGQQGCSSPRTVIWLSGNDCVPQIKRFWDSVLCKSEEIFGDDLVTADIMNKVVATNLMAVNSCGSRIYQQGKMLSRIIISDISQHNSLRNLHCGSGLFIEISVNGFEELSSIVDRKVQTISYFGFNHEELKNAFFNSGVFPDRVVPVGNALDFSVKWDGFNLLNSLTRIIDFK